MIITIPSTILDPGGKPTFKRENWLEYFRIIISYQTQRRLKSKGHKLPLPKGYYYLRYDPIRDHKHYWHFAVWPLAWLAYWSDKKWYRFAFILCDLGYLKHIEGEKLPFFWLRNIRLKRISKHVTKKTKQ